MKSKIIIVGACGLKVNFLRIAEHLNSCSLALVEITIFSPNKQKKYFKKSYSVIFRCLFFLIQRLAVDVSTKKISNSP